MRNHPDDKRTFLRGAALPSDLTGSDRILFDQAIANLQALADAGKMTFGVDTTEHTMARSGRRARRDRMTLEERAIAPTARIVHEVMKRDGLQWTPEIAVAMESTPMRVRTALHELKERGFVTAKEEAAPSAGKGRRLTQWTLTDKPLPPKS